MKWLTLEKIKQQCRIESDFTAEDSRLESYGASAESTILNHLNRTYHDVLEEYGQVPEDIVNASLMLVDVWYQHRSPVEGLSMSIVPYTFDILIKPYMKLSGTIYGDAQTVTLGSDAKIAFTAELPAGLTMKDVPFTVTVYNADATNSEVVVNKDGCAMVSDNEYVVMVDSDELGVGVVMLKVVFQIPDTDFPTGYRREVVRINPNVRITG